MLENETFVGILIRAAITVAIFLAGRYLIRLMLKLIDRLTRKNRIDITLSRFLKPLTEFCMTGLLVLICAAELGFNTASIAAIIGSCGVAVVVSLKDSLSNLAGGVVILLTRPFSVGQYIESVEGNGTVREIGIAYTTIETFERNIIVIPNSKMSNVSVSNYSTHSIRRIDVDVAVAYGSDIDQVKEILVDTFRKSPEIRQDVEIYAYVKELQSSGILLSVYGSAQTTGYFKIKYAMIEQVYKNLTASGIGIPFDQLTIHVPENVRAELVQTEAAPETQM